MRPEVAQEHTENTEYRATDRRQLVRQPCYMRQPACIAVLCGSPTSSKSFGASAPAATSLIATTLPAYVPCVHICGHVRASLLDGDSPRPSPNSPGLIRTQHTTTRLLTCLAPPDHPTRDHGTAQRGMDSPCTLAPFRQPLSHPGAGRRRSRRPEIRSHRGVVQVSWEVGGSGPESGACATIGKAEAKCRSHRSHTWRLRMI